VQTGIAIDPHRRENGAMLVYPGSHHMGELPLGEDRVMHRPLEDEDLRLVGLDPADARVLELEPGDVALWHLYTVHGSGPNRSTIDRRFYINGYVKASMCDRGEWAFRAASRVPSVPPSSCTTGSSRPSPRAALRGRLKGMRPLLPHVCNRPENPMG
jgi:Phytanoyl-CoA dioxygenase (PhyH)